MSKKYLLVAAQTSLLSLATVLTLAEEEAAASGIGKIAKSIEGNLQAVGSLIAQVAFVAGMGFFVSAVFKFKQHKDNPTQVPIGTPMSMLGISAALMFMGNFISPLGETLFGAGDGTDGVEAGKQGVSDDVWGNSDKR
ncbi:type IV secretion protein IcmD [Candidatus Synchoanobacter obligatus]|uniref:Type IV secretion protein IcmD n=1 Tax=Candidatus Synchoanobacter obligatus TaxID=2919597 RepID=A0ABT1L6N7_9GAMM|nr:type IV secretion protein IcmD [Candidatus Synchoanobacter obligatus]MCP8352380.1 type IV secretion protein IcmD [Candidatus Synchoanobacter obligatus]